MKKATENIQYYQWDSASQQCYLEQYVQLADSVQAQQKAAAAAQAAAAAPGGGSPPPQAIISGSQVHLLDVATVDEEKIKEAMNQICKQAPAKLTAISGVALEFADQTAEAAAIQEIRKNQVCGVLVNESKCKILLGVESTKL